MKSILFLSTALLLSGCLGVPDGAGDVGDSVTVDWAAFDSITGTRLAGASGLTFVIGSGDSGLGAEVERAVIAQVPGETIRIQVELSSRATADAVFGPFDLELSVPRLDFERAIGAPSLNQTFQVSFYDASVTAFDDAQVTYRVHAVDGQRDPVDFVGATLVTHVDGDQMTQELDPIVGATFTIQPSQTGETALGLAPGAYKSVGREGDQIVFDYIAGGNVDLIGVPVDLEVTVTSVRAANAAPPNLDNLGVRVSPQLGGTPPEDHSDHGHTH